MVESWNNLMFDTPSNFTESTSSSLPSTVQCLSWCAILLDSFDFLLTHLKFCSPCLGPKHVPASSAGRGIIIATISVIPLTLSSAIQIQTPLYNRYPNEFLHFRIKSQYRVQSREEEHYAKYIMTRSVNSTL